MMKSRKSRVLVAIALAVAIFFVGVYVAGSNLLSRLEPMVREQAIRYLEEHFHSDVQLAALHINLPHLSKFGLVFRKQQGAIVQVDGERLTLSRAGMKLLDIDSSLANRKELAQELGFTGDTNDSATMNTWLHKRVMQELEKNGGKVSASLVA